MVNKKPESISTALPKLYLARHGETEWSATGRHTGRTDLLLTDRGKQDSMRFRERLSGLQFSLVMSSPLQRAFETCKLAGFESQATIDSDLIEWNYGDFEGRTNAQIRSVTEDWVVFRDGCPGGESVKDVIERADRIVGKVRASSGNTLLFSSGHFLRLLATRWLGLDSSCGSLLLLGTASLSILGYNHSLDEPAVHLWNDVNVD